MKKDVLYKFSLILRSSDLLPEPPISTILGNFGIISSKFCEEYNLFTKNLPNYFFFEVKVIIHTDKSFVFFIEEPSLTFFCRSLCFKKDITIVNNNIREDITINVINIEELFFLSFLKFGSFDDKYLRIILGFLFSMDIYVCG